MMLSHYKFKQHLNNKAIEYGCKVYDVSEEYTSLTCSLCGLQSKNYDNKRVKNCNCGHKVDRDILIKNIYMVLLKEGRKPEATIKP
jgi:transposase